MTLPEILARPPTLPLVCAPMFIASGSQLVTAQCQSGVIGANHTSLPARELIARFTEQYDQAASASEQQTATARARRAHE